MLIQHNCVPLSRQTLPAFLCPPYCTTPGENPHNNFPRAAVLTDKPFASYRQAHGLNGQKGWFQHESQMPIALLGAQWEADSDAGGHFLVLLHFLGGPCNAQPGVNFSLGDGS
jgi:hypothetical protein